jgi:hypothetical protein
MEDYLILRASALGGNWWKSVFSVRLRRTMTCSSYGLPDDAAHQQHCDRGIISKTRKTPGC